MKTKNDLLENFLRSLSTEIDLLNHVDLDNVTDYDSLYNEVEESGGFEVDIIYYATAMEYLMENDCSLNESLAIASEMGFTPENLSSETLASLLASQKAREEFADLESEVTDFFTDLDYYQDLLDDLENSEDPEEIRDLEAEIEELSEELENN